MIELLEVNFNLHASRITAKTTGMHVFQSGNLSYVDSGLSCDTFNIIHITNGQAVSREEIEAALSHFRRQNRDFCIWISENNLLPKVEAILHDCRTSRQNAEMGMLLDLNTYTPSHRFEHDAIAEVDSEALLEAYASVVSAHWNPPDTNIVRYYAQTASHYLDRENQIRLFLNYRDQLPVSTLELFPTDTETAGIYGFATLQAYRGTGAGSALFEYALNTAKTLGFRNVILQATGAGIGIYRKYGFQEVGWYFEYA